MPVPKSLKEKIKRAVNREYKDLSLKRRKHIEDAIIYHNLGFGRGKK